TPTAKKSTISGSIRYIRSAFTSAVLALMCLSGAHAQNLTVFAAASLKNALDEIESQYQKRSGAQSVISYASSSALAKQIESGAPADIFISADPDWMDYVEKRGLVKGGSRANLLRQELGLSAPSDSQATVTIGRKFPLARLLGSGRLAMADPDSVPAGKYGKAALEFLEVWPTGAGNGARAENGGAGRVSGG